MAFVYILQSKKRNRFYVGSCINLIERLKQHSEKVYVGSFTSSADDWELFLSIDGLEYKQARIIEMYIKKRKSSIYIKRLKVEPAAIDKLKSM